MKLKLIEIKYLMKINELLIRTGIQLKWQSARLACERYRDRYPISPGRDSIGVSTSRCGRDDPGSNPGHGIFILKTFFNLLKTKEKVNYLT